MKKIYALSVLIANYWIINAAEDPDLKNVFMTDVIQASQKDLCIGLGGEDLMEIDQVADVIVQEEIFNLHIDNPRTTMRLSAEVEADLSLFAPKLDGGYIRFFFLNNLDEEIGRLEFSKIIPSPRIGISDEIVIPPEQFVIAYDFRNAENEQLFGMHWICNSVHNKEGSIQLVFMQKKKKVSK